MAAPVGLRGGATLYWVDPERGVVDAEPVAPDPPAAARAIALGLSEFPRSRWTSWLERAGGPSPRVSPELSRALESAGLSAPPATDRELRAARARLPPRTVPEERRLLLAVARIAAARALAGPEETLIGLAREEARLERALGRELSAASQWVAAGPTSVLGAHAEAQRRFGERFREHFAELSERRDAAARALVPNLSRLLGPKVAGRLVAAAGSRAALARASGARLQLLGARRRPQPEGGPRFGVIFRAPGLEELPEEARGRYARSLAALAVIAARADHFTGRDLGGQLETRRERRLAELRRRRT